MSGQFVPLAISAFASVVAEFELELLDSGDDEWVAFVTWGRGLVRLRVSDDRHDRFVQVLIVRPALPGGAELDRVGDDSSLPLWAIIEAAGGTVPEFGGDTRLQQLDSYASATSAFAGEYLRDPSRPADAVRSVMRRHLHESSDEARKSRRFLP